MTDYSKLRKEGKLFGTIKRAKELSADRRATRVRSKKRSSLVYSSARRMLRDKYRAIVPLSSKCAHEVTWTVRPDFPRRKNWESAEAEISLCFPYCYDVDNGQYSQRCYYTHWTYRPTVGCYAVIVKNHRAINFYYAGEKSVLFAPKGYKWIKDENGIALASRDGRKDYHPDSDELRNYSKKGIRAKAIANYEKRKEQKKAERKELALVKKAQKEGARICLADSVRAGNCRAGSIAFGDRHGLNPVKHYTPSQLLKIANGDAHRVKLAVASGLRRHRQEMKSGFCVIEDHRA